MIEVTFEIKGRKVSLDQFCDAIQKSAIELTTKHLQKHLRDIRCPEHDKAPRLIARGDSAANLRWDVDGCCVKLNELVQAKMEGILSQ